MTSAFLGSTSKFAVASPPNNSRVVIAPVPPRPKEISVVVPVRDNAAGIARLMRWWHRLTGDERPAQLIIVDDGSALPVVADLHGVRVVRRSGRGPAAARNTGWRSATTRWIAFTDSDCIPQSGWPLSFASGWSGEVGVQGAVKPVGDDALSRFYDSQGILRPMLWTRDGRPQYLITANALVLRDALDAIGGFDETFLVAAGEDVDLGLRLAEYGDLRWCASAVVAHDFGPSLTSFMRRFVRYGRGNRHLAARSSMLRSQLVPRPFRPSSSRVVDYLLAGVAWGSLTAGWILESLSCRSDDSQSMAETSRP